MQPQPLQNEQVEPDAVSSRNKAQKHPRKLSERLWLRAHPAMMPAAATDQLRLTLKFSGECWTEISDADGQRLFYSMGRDGQSVELSGKAPVSALFGNADNVEVTVNDSAYALPVPDSSNRTVRVAILNQ